MERVPGAGRATGWQSPLWRHTPLLCVSPAAPLTSPSLTLLTSLHAITLPHGALRASSEPHSGPAVVRGWRLGTGGGKAVAWVAAAECHEALLGAAGSGGRSQMSAP